MGEMANQRESDDQDRNVDEVRALFDDRAQNRVMDPSQEVITGERRDRELLCCNESDAALAER